jgi:hypothetical protein
MSRGFVNLAAKFLRCSVQIAVVKGFAIAKICKENVKILLESRPEAMMGAVMRRHAMDVKSSWPVGVILTLCLAVAGCHGPSAKPSALGEEMPQEMAQAAPTVGGPSREFPVERRPADVATRVEAALEDSGIHLVREGSSDGGQWLLGKSLADRSVLVRILPIYPGRSTVKVTVEGGDALARDLLNHLSADVLRRAR